MTQLMISAVTRQTGTSKAGNKYEMNRARVLMPFSSRSTQNFQLSGSGLVEVELAVEDSAAGPLHAAFNASFKGLPVLIECDTSLGDGGVTRISAVRPKS